MYKLLHKIFICYLLLLNMQTHSKEFLIHVGTTVGLSAHLCSVIGLLHNYEAHQIAGFKVAFDKNGLYYDVTKGPNWWEYYFEPIALGNYLAPKRVTSPHDLGHFGVLALCRLPIARCNQLINKYIKFKPHITKKVNDFFRQNLQNTFIIGVHYRGTDKKFEAKRIDYAQVYATIHALIQRKRLVNYKLFVATDEQAFIDYIKTKFRNVVYTNAHRSIDGQPVHYSVVNGRPQERDNAYSRGEECIIDMLLLARSHVFVRTASTLGACAMFINPKMEVISLSTNFFASCPRDRA